MINGTFSQPGVFSKWQKSKNSSLYLFQTLARGMESAVCNHATLSGLSDIELSFSYF